MRLDRHATAVAGAILALIAGAQPAHALPPVAEQVPRTDCRAAVGYQFNATLPGYAVREGSRGRTCVPFAQVDLPPPGYRGDWLVQRFSDARGRRLLGQCRAQPPCAAAVAAEGFQPTEFRATGALVPFGRIDPQVQRVDLRAIRRPGFFGRKPYEERIARAERRASTFELRVPPDPYERIGRGLTRPDHVRGWYLEGRGVPDGRGRRVRGLVILLGGRSIETTAIQDPRDPAYTRDPITGRYVGSTYPARGTEKWGARQWRAYLYEVWHAGLDVLSFDKRGHGISGSIIADDTLQQGLDMLRAIRALDTGQGVRTLGPDGKERFGRAAVRTLVDPGQARRMPMVIGGASQGSIATDWAMHANVDRWCSYDLPGAPCHRPWGLRNIAGAALLASFPVYAFQGDVLLLDEAAKREIAHVAFLPTSEPLAGIRRWPRAFFAKGLWDEIQGPWPTFNAYLRVRGPKELFLYRGPHSEAEGGAANVALQARRLTRFAVDAVLRRPHRRPRLRTLKDAVAASPPIWEASTRPTAP